MQEIVIAAFLRHTVRWANGVTDYVLGRLPPIRTEPQNPSSVRIAHHTLRMRPSWSLLHNT